MDTLIADDSSSFRAFLKRVLEAEGHRIVPAENGRDALTILSSRDAPKLAILDWVMPELDGIEVCQRIRKQRDHGDLYIIMITGNEDENGVVSALDAGANDFLNKPCRRAELLARVRAGMRTLKLHSEKIDMLARLQQQQRLESIGRLAAGIAHEINTPVQYIGDNTRFISNALSDILSVIQAARDLAAAAARGNLGSADITAFETRVAAADLEFLDEQIPLAVKQSLEGLGRVTDIVRAMKEFAHPGAGDFAPRDINHALTSMVTVTRNEWKYVADLTTAFDPHLPMVPCLLGELNQVAINMIVNAAHAIAEKQRVTGREEKGRITLGTRRAEDGAFAEILISDTGSGIPAEIRSRVFDPFFTTKAVGQGTGQGLAIAYSVIVDKHQGEISLDTEEGVGTTFTIRLPLKRPDLAPGPSSHS